MKVVSWNINSVRARLDQVKRLLVEVAPDILCLQETKTPDSEFPVETFKDQGYFTARTGQPGYNGVALVSRFPFESVEIGHWDGTPDEDRRLIRGVVSPPGAPPFEIWSVYVPNGKSLDSPSFPDKLRFLERLERTVERRSAQLPLVVGGDFNIARDNRDVFDPSKMAGQLHFSPAEHAALQQFLAAGLIDSLREKNSAAGVFSWWDYRMQSFRRNRGLRIDYLFVTRDIASSLEDAWVERAPRGWDKPSDHAPVAIEFHW